MADYNFTVVSNEFKTKNNKEVADVFSELGFEETYVNENEGTVFVGSYNEQTWNDNYYVVIRKTDNKVIGAYDTENAELEFYLESKGLDSDNLDLYEEKELELYTQEMLVEDSNYFALKETGNEKLRYNCGWGIVITPYDIKEFSLDNIMKDFAEKSLKDKGNK